MFIVVVLAGVVFVTNLTFFFEFQFCLPVSMLCILGEYETERESVRMTQFSCR